MTTSDARKRAVEGLYTETIRRAAQLMRASLDVRWWPVADMIERHVALGSDGGYAYWVATDYLGGVE